MRATKWMRGAAIVCALGLVPVTAIADKAAAADPETLTILNFNDFHGRIAKSRPSTMAFLQAIETHRETSTEANTLVLSAGDNIGASLFESAIAADKPTLDVLSTIGVDASAVGNHEFDRGMDDLTGRVGTDGSGLAKFSYLGANVYAKGTTKPALPEYKTFDRAGKKVAVVGAVTGETATLVNPDGIKTLDFGDPVEAVNRVTDQLTDGNPNNGEADVVIAEYHEGGPSSGTLEQNMANPEFKALIDKTSAKVAAIMTGHTHQKYVYDAPVPGKSGATRPVIQTGSYAENLGKVVLTFDGKNDDGTARVASYTAENVAVAQAPATPITAPRLVKAQEILDQAFAEAEDKGKEVVGAATGPITRAYNAEGKEDRGAESTIGNLVADAMLEQLKPAHRGGAQIAIQNPGGNRADFAKGDITLRDAANILPFANTLMTMNLTGAQFTKVLEEQWQPESASRSFLQLGVSSNVNVTYDSTKPKGQRVTGVWVDSKPIDAKATYRVGMASFLASGGDNFTTLAEGTDKRDSGLADLESFLDYVRTTKTISPDFGKRAVEVTADKAVVKPGEKVTISFKSVDFTSKGAPANTSVTAQVNPELGSFPVAGGAGTIEVTVPANVTATGEIMLTALPTKTSFHSGVRVAGADVLTPTPTPTVPAPTTTPTVAPTSPPAPRPPGLPPRTGN